MKGPKVSIVMPCYQSGQTVERTVRSIQAQTMEDWELIAVDDGSVDDTLDVLRRLAAQEPRMRVIHQENGGVSAARNAGMERASGEWLSFVDADDWLTPQALAALLVLAREDEETDIACGAYVMRYADEGGREEKYVCANGDRQCMIESLIRGDSALNSMYACLYRTSMIRDGGIAVPVGIKVGEDVLFNLEAFSAARAWRVSEETVYVYEFGGDSAMTRAKREIYAVSRPMLREIGRFLDVGDRRTRYFRAHIDIYLRTLRADRGRLRAALAMTYAVAGEITRGVRFGGLRPKEKIYFLALRTMPLLSYFIP